MHSTLFYIPLKKTISGFFNALLVIMDHGLTQIFAFTELLVILFAKL